MFNYEKYNALMSLLKKEAQFVPMDPSMAGGPPPGDPAAGGGMPPEGGMPPDAGMPPEGGMPPDAGMPPPGDPAAMGAPPPMDPAAMGAPPPPPMEDPAAGGDVSPSGEPYMKITPTQLSKLFKQFAEVFKSVLGLGNQTGAAPAAPQTDPNLQAKMTEIDAKISALMGGN